MTTRIYNLNRVDAARLMLNADEDIGEELLKSQDRFGHTLLHLAILTKQTQLAQDMLIMKGGRACLELKDHRGDTPLHEAVRLGDIRVIEDILKWPEGRKSAAVKNNMGITPLQLFLQRPDCMESRLLLAFTQTQPNIKDSNSGQTLLMRAAKAGKIELMKDLMLHGADPHIKDNAGKTVEDYISPEHKDNITSLLQSYKAVEQEFKNGFEKEFLKAIRQIASPTNDDFVRVFNKTLNTCYTSTSSDRTTEVLTREVVESCQFHFVVRFFLRIAALLNITSYEELMMNRLNVAIQDTDAFSKFIAHSDIGKQTVASFEKKLEASKEPATRTI